MSNPLYVPDLGGGGGGTASHDQIFLMRRKLIIACMDFDFMDWTCCFDFICCLFCESRCSNSRYVGACGLELASSDDINARVGLRFPSAK